MKFRMLICLSALSLSLMSSVSAVAGVLSANIAGVKEVEVIVANCEADARPGIHIMGTDPGAFVLSSGPSRTDVSCYGLLLRGVSAIAGSSGRLIRLGNIALVGGDRLSLGDARKLASLIKEASTADSKPLNIELDGKPTTLTLSELDYDDYKVPLSSVSDRASGLSVRLGSLVVSMTRPASFLGVSFNRHRSIVVGALE
jgi:hypothetical protein